MEEIKIFLTVAEELHFSRTAERLGISRGRVTQAVKKHERLIAEVMRWIRDGSVRDEHQTRGGIQAWESEWESEGFGLFAVEIRFTGELAGFTGISVPNFLPEALPAVEVGWRLGRSGGTAGG